MLRYDDRGIGESTGEYTTATTADFAEDAMSGIEFLKTRSDIRHGKIGIIGHSEGGIIALMLASRYDSVAFIVLMSGTGVPGEQILLKQRELQLKARGASEARPAENRSLWLVFT